MASSEVVLDSGKVRGGRSKSNFSQTCSLLSQYLKENGSFGDLTLGLITPKAEPKETMNLLPMIEKSGCGEENSVKKTAPMTIFYAGQVIVFNDFPADKAEEIMRIATKSAGSAPAAAQKTQSGAVLAPPQEAAPVECPAKASSIVPPQPALGSDLPIARKNSLARFLEKRKDRITANAPYQPPKPKTVAANGDARLGFSAQFPLQIQRN